MKKIILFLAANPRNTSRLRLDLEFRAIESGLQRSQQREKFILKQQWAIRAIDARRAMLDYKPNFVHFCGHGEGEHGLDFENEMGCRQLVSAEALSGLFELFANKVECVLLNACYSEIQAEAIAQHIDYVIGMKESINDSAAVEFAVAFYDALGAGESIEFAFKFGCNAIQLLGISEYLVPVLKSKYNKNTNQSFGENDIKKSSVVCQSDYSLGEMRGKLNNIFDDAELDSFCMSTFPEVYDKFGRGLRKDEKINLLLDYCRRIPEAFHKLSFEMSR